MSSPAPDVPEPPARSPEPAWKEFARAPLMPVAVAATIGLVADRYGYLPGQLALLTAAVGLIGWLIDRARGAPLAPGWLWLAAAALAAAYHHEYRHSYPADDIGAFATERPVPAVVRGALDEEPARYRAPKPDPLLTIQKPETTTTVLAVRAIDTPDGWKPASGRVRLTVEGRLDGLHLGDVIEVAGRLVKPGPPANPGEWDYRSFLLDRRITADLRAKGSADAVTRLDEGWRASLFGWLAVVRGWGSRVLHEHLPPPEAAIAAALLLGDGTAMDRAEWDAFVRTGVVHVLAISGQHLVVLAGFVWLVLRVCGTRRRYGAWVVMGVMVGYALLTGGRPSAVRAAVMVCVLCGGLVLRRPVNLANSFAFAWLVVILANPTDPFTAGCQLSFLCVFVLIWGAGKWLAPRQLTPLQQLVEESRTLPEKIAHRVAHGAWVLYAVSLTLAVVNAPLILAWHNLVSPVGVLLGPPLVLLASVALIAGFLLLLVAPLGTWAAWPFARLTESTLAGCGWFVRVGERVPGGWVYSPAPPVWWLVGFYALLAGIVLLAGRWRARLLAGLAAWTLLGLALSFHKPPTDEVRFTFLAVGHGGCVVIETPDGRVLLYDAGTITGPDSVRRTIAPYLWHRGVTRIDELFLSHADLDHFNGVPELLKRFPVGQVTFTPSFAERPTPGVAAALAALDRHVVPRRVAKAGDRFAAGDLSFEVLHPPQDGPPGTENARSLVLLVRHAGHTVLLTGDLEGVGQEMVCARSIEPVDVMLAPHHGAVSANAPLREPGGKASPGLMAAWARPKLVVSCMRPGRTDHLAESYGAVGATVRDTPTAGAVTVRSHRTGLVAEAFLTGEVKVVRRGGER